MRLEEHMKVLQSAGADEKSLRKLAEDFNIDYEELKQRIENRQTASLMGGPPRRSTSQQSKEIEQPPPPPPQPEPPAKKSQRKR